MFTMSEVMQELPRVEKRRLKRQVKTCGSKQQFHTEAKATAHLATLPERFSECRAYECCHCGCWHIGRVRNHTNV
jgi:hypothetical protein